MRNGSYHGGRKEARADILVKSSAFFWGRGGGWGVFGVGKIPVYPFV